MFLSHQADVCSDNLDQGWLVSWTTRTLETEQELDPKLDELLGSPSRLANGLWPHLASLLTVTNPPGMCSLWPDRDRNLVASALLQSLPVLTVFHCLLHSFRVFEFTTPEKTRVQKLGWIYTLNILCSPNSLSPVCCVCPSNSLLLLFPSVRTSHF